MRRGVSWRGSENLGKTGSGSEKLGVSRSVSEGGARRILEKLGESRREGDCTEKAAYGFRQLFVIITCVV